MRPTQIKLYHIVHIDKLSSIIEHGGLLCDEYVIKNNLAGTTIGMSSIKKRRLEELKLNTYPDLYVGQCVPFYFAPRSVMLYMIHVKSNELEYKGEQSDIIHLECDLTQLINWANTKNKRWVFTSSNAGSYYFEDTNNLANLANLDWHAIQTRQWKNVVSQKQAEFLVEGFLDFKLVTKIGVKTDKALIKTKAILDKSSYKPALELMPNWYY